MSEPGASPASPASLAVEVATGFCPVPHTTRDQVWLAVGATLGLGIGYLLARRPAPPQNVSPLAHGPVRVCVEFHDVADPEKFKELYKDLVAGSRTMDKGCVQYDLLQSQKDPVRPSVARFCRWGAWLTTACAGAVRRSSSG